MTKKEAFAIFQEELYGDKYDFLRELERDPIKVKCEWLDFVDYLCKDGQITGRQQDTWQAPAIIERARAKR